MNCLFPNLYISLKADSAIDFIKSNYSNSSINIAIELLPNGEILNDLYVALTTIKKRGQFSFFFIISKCSYIDVTNVGDIGRFFFLSNYLFRDRVSPLVSFSPDVSIITQDAIVKWCLKQGFCRLDILFTTCFDKVEVDPKSVFVIDSSMQEDLFQTLSSYSSALKFFSQPIVISLKTYSEVEELIGNILQFRKLLMKEKPELYYLLSYLSELESNKLKHNVLIAYLQEENKNLKEFFELVKASSETQKILEFYHLQYEALPLWYKRFGHVIKFLMGKRKFSSFFNRI